MRTFLQILTGIVIAFLILVGVGYVAIHRLIHSPHSSNPVASTTSSSGSTAGNQTKGGGNSSSSKGSSGNGSSGSASSTGNSSNASSTSNDASTSNGAGGASGSANSSSTNTTGGTGPSTSEQQSISASINVLLNNPPNPPVDSSALVQQVYKQAGVSLPRTVSQQATAGTPVSSKSDLQYGDIVFFDLSKQPNTPTFDGIYVGNNQFVAKTTHGIMTIGLDSSYWKDKFLYGEHVN